MLFCSRLQPVLLNKKTCAGYWCLLLFKHSRDWQSKITDRKRAKSDFSILPTAERQIREHAVVWQLSFSYNLFVQLGNYSPKGGEYLLNKEAYAITAFWQPIIITCDIYLFSLWNSSCSIKLTENWMKGGESNEETHDSIYRYSVCTFYDRPLLRSGSSSSSSTSTDGREEGRWEEGSG